MPEFFVTKRGTFVNLDEVIQITKHGKSSCYVTTKSGETHCIKSPVDEVTMRCASKAIVPAHPGFFVVCIEGATDDGKLSVIYVPIVAWSIAVNPGPQFPNDAFPVVAGARVFGDHCAILSPTGIVIEEYGKQFTSVDSWLHDYKNRFFGSL